MYCIVPLAGPDFFNPKYGIKPLIPYKGTTLMESVLNARSWRTDIDEFIFILQDTSKAQEFIDYIGRKINNAHFVIISKSTKGALLSSLAGISIVHDFSKPLILDLIDIDYSSATFDPKKIFNNHEIAGIIPYFESQDPAYSYVVTDEENVLLESAEKKVISDKASAGTYFFRDALTFLKAAEGVLNNETHYSVNNSLYVCPAYNELVKLKKKVLAVKVNLIESISKQIKAY